MERNCRLRQAPRNETTEPQHQSYRELIGPLMYFMNTSRRDVVYATTYFACFVYYTKEQTIRLLTYGHWLAVTVDFENT